MSDQIEDLQTRISYQEASIDELTRTVTEQQRRLAELTHMVEQLRQQVRDLSVSSPGQSQDHEPPPHY